MSQVGPTLDSGAPILHWAMQVKTTQSAERTGQHMTVAYWLNHAESAMPTLGNASLSYRSASFFSVQRLMVIAFSFLTSGEERQDFQGNHAAFSSWAELRS